MPQFASDTFTEAVDTALTSHTGEVGGIWTKNTGIGAFTAPTVVGATDRVRLNTTNEWAGYASGSPASPDYDVSVVLTVVTRDGYCGPVGRQITNDHTYYQVAIDSAGTSGEGYSLGKYLSGVWSLLAEYVVTPQTGDIIMLRMRGTLIQMLINGIVRGQVTDSSITAAGKAGIYGAQYAVPGNAVGYHFDNFTAEDAPQDPSAQGKSPTVGNTIAAARAVAAGWLCIEHTRRRMGRRAIASRRAWRQSLNARWRTCLSSAERDGGGDAARGLEREAERRYSELAADLRAGSPLRTSA